MTGHWVRKPLTKEGLIVKKHKKKHLFCEKEMVRFTTTFWTVDGAVFVHPHNRAQIPWLFDLFLWTGARICAFLVDSKTKSKGGLHYKAYIQIKYHPRRAPLILCR